MKGRKIEKFIRYERQVGGESHEASFPNKEAKATKGKAGYSVRWKRVSSL